MDIEQKLGDIHTRKRTIEEVRTDAERELAEAARKIQEGRERLSDIESSLRECAELQEKFLRQTGSEDTAIAGMAQGFAQARVLLSSRIADYEALHNGLLSSLKKADELLGTLAKERTSSVN